MMITTARVMQALWIFFLIHPAFGADRYVSLEGTNDFVNKFNTWSGAATDIQWAVNNALAGETVWVSNGTYYLTNQISITADVKLRSFSGSWADTIINGNNYNGKLVTNRCVFINHPDATIDGFTISNGFTIGTYGGGAMVQRGGVFNCRVVYNTASNHYGGGIGVNSIVVAMVNITNCIITHNAAMRGGGVGAYDGFQAYRGSLAIEGCDVSSNTIYQGPNEPFGGGIHFYGSNLTVRNCKVVGNRLMSAPTGSGYGGGISIMAYHVDVLIENCKIIGNILSNLVGIAGGGGLHLSGGGSTVRNCLIGFNNCYNVPRGGGLYIEQASKTNLVESCTIVGNTSLPGFPGAGIYMAGNGYDVVMNCVVYSNRNNTAADWSFGDLSRTNYVHYTCSPQTMGGNDNITANPLFANWADGNYALSVNSPCINAGSNAAWMGGAMDLGFHSRKDRFSGIVDMGCYEYLPRGMMYKIR
ncbi:MAG: hypothetical protein WC299_01890 [Kiritimatiellia bacterium]